MSLYEQLKALQDKQGTMASNQPTVQNPVVPTDAQYLEYVAETLSAQGFGINTAAMSKAPASRVGGPSILLALLRKGSKPGNVTIWWNGKSSWAGIDPITSAPVLAPKAKAKPRARKPKPVAPPAPPAP